MTNQSDINTPIVANESRIYVLQTCYGAEEKGFTFEQIDMVMVTICLLIGMVLLAGLCCLCIKMSDLKLKHYIIKTAQKKGIKVDIDKLDSKTYCPPKDDTCTIMVPDVCIIAA